MSYGQSITLSRDCDAMEIPSGEPLKLPAGLVARVMQFAGSSYTVTSSHGMFRVDAKDADALGLTPPNSQTAAPDNRPFSEDLVWEQLKTVYDPEIPVNIADLGLIYVCTALPVQGGGHRIDIKMSMTAPGCGMGNVLKADVESKLARLPDVKEVHVEIVFDPPWGPDRMSEAARLQLGFDV
ncbi:MAG TPA: putative Fe-S cluster assembly protein SufT [Candidatus Aquilonibacter sp.]|nr:putative Fe-S cluster assembly protein SufT [Candidatus Aquilonibacter sp.]